MQAQLPQKMVALGTQRSVIRELFDFGNQRAAQVGAENVFDFSIGNPSVAAPACVNETAMDLLQNSDPVMLHGYTSAQGDLTARSLLASSINQRFGTNFGPENLYITVGAAASLCCCFNGLCGPGDEVIVFAPYFPEYKVFIEGAGAKMVLIPADTEAFQIDFTALEKAITPKTKLLILPFPNNPTGALMSREQLEEIVNLLDELSQYMDIDVKYTMEDLGAGFMVEKLTVTLGTGKQNTLIDGEYAAKIGRLPKNDNYNIQLYALRDADGQKKDNNDTDPVKLGDNDLYGSLQARREMLTESGEYTTKDTVDKVDKNAAVKRGIPYYRHALDSLARELAKEMNTLNNVKDAAIPGEGNLFSIGSDTNDTTDANGGITAANISVSKGWREGSISMIPSRDPGASSGDTSNLAAFLSLFEKTVEFDPKTLVGDAVGAPYEGTFEDMLLHIQSTLAEDQMSTSSVYNNYAITANEIYTDRDSLSGVDLNDEATNLMVYQKAYTAACRLMTTLDEALDSLLAM